MDAITGSRIIRTSLKCRDFPRASQRAFKGIAVSLSVIIASICLLIAIAHANANQVNSKNYVNQQQANQQERQKAALEAELNTIVQQHDNRDGNNKQLAEAIISRLMLDNLTGSTLFSGTGSGNVDLENDIVSIGSESTNQPNELMADSNPSIYLPEEPIDEPAAPVLAGPTGPEAMRLKKLLSFLQSYEANSVGGPNYDQYPILQAGQAATMKRAAMKMGAFLQQPQRHLSASNYARNSYDFGLGKRPDSTISGNILRFGDSASLGLNGGGSIQPVGQFGKRPSANRFDFGLGKRVASPAYPRYDFGLGKRAPNRIRYDFGLGRK